jgi:hypothetical protein
VRTVPTLAVCVTVLETAAWLSMNVQSPRSQSFSALFLSSRMLACASHRDETAGYGQAPQTLCI